ncbi:hypothetical protein HanPSC8_Chr09g0397761 [Helianthus annuus]|nr:hypothetical protein HanPSC8_Chr09g0397761 [Helianthus annuus]
MICEIRVEDEYREDEKSRWAEAVESFGGGIEAVAGIYGGCIRHGCVGDGANFW